MIKFQNLIVFILLNKYNVAPTSRFITRASSHMQLSMKKPIPVKVNYRVHPNWKLEIIYQQFNICRKNGFLS